MERPKALIINNVEFPVAYDGYTQGRNKIWSKNTGRTNSGKMVGTILAIKNKFECQLAPITPEKAKIIDEIVSDINNPFPKIKALYLDGTQKEVTIYTGDINYHWLGSAIAGGGLITGVQINCIEQ